MRATHSLPDRELVESYLERRDETAFAALVERHGPMVLGVCRSVLRHNQDAEDAFQATFLVLARKAGSIRRRNDLGSWLCCTWQASSRARWCSSARTIAGR